MALDKEWSSLAYRIDTQDESVVLARMNEFEQLAKENQWKPVVFDHKHRSLYMSFSAYPTIGAYNKLLSAHMVYLAELRSMMHSGGRMPYVLAMWRTEAPALIVDCGNRYAEIVIVFDLLLKPTLQHMTDSFFQQRG